SNPKRIASRLQIAAFASSRNRGGTTPTARRATSGGRSSGSANRSMGVAGFSQITASGGVPRSSRPRAASRHSAKSLSEVSRTRCTMRSLYVLFWNCTTRHRPHGGLARGGNKKEPSSRTKAPIEDAGGRKPAPHKSMGTRLVYRRQRARRTGAVDDVIRRQRGGELHQLHELGAIAVLVVAFGATGEVGDLLPIHIAIV